jgi:hypothetical protein
MQRLIVHISLVTLLLLPALPGFGQRFRLSAGTGYSLPMGQFAAHDFETGGYALLGFHSACEASWLFSKHFGVFANITGNSYNFATGWYMQDYIEQDPFLSHLEMRSTPYYVRTYMLGGVYTFNVWKKFSADAKLGGGIFTARTPDQFFGGNYYVVGNLFWSKTSSFDAQAGFMGGLNLRYKLFEHTDLELAGEFAYSAPRFRYIRGDTEYIRTIRMPVFHLRPAISINF